MAHMRRWNQREQYWMVRVKAGSKVRTSEGDCSISVVDEQLGYQSTRQVMCQGQPCTQWIGGTHVVLARAAKPNRVGQNGQRVKTVAGD